MSLVTVSSKRKRVYQRKFDHEEALRRFAAGEKGPALAADYGVSVSAIYIVVSPKIRERYLAYQAAKQRSGICPDCGTPSSFNYSRGGSRRCIACMARRNVTSVRDTELRCTTCQEWKPDTEFGGDKTQPARRGRHPQCRPCNTIARREYRRRQHTQKVSPSTERRTP